MGLFSKALKVVPFLKHVYKERYLILDLFESGAIRFIKFSPPGHFYSPIPDIHQIEKKADSIFNCAIKDLSAIDLNSQYQLDLVTLFVNFYEEIPFADKPKSDFRYYFKNAYFSYGDGIVAYAFLRHLNPKKIIEVGSGFSSALMLDVNDLYLNREVHFTFIEPYPERLMQLLSEQDKAEVSIIEELVQNIDLNLFESLDAGDILFIDSSHVAKIGSDVLHILFEILPVLKKGVYIHFHDILWPFEYPEHWVKEGRAWNEAYFLRAFLQNNSDYEVAFFNSYMESNHSEVLNVKMPKAMTISGPGVSPSNTSIWLRKKCEA